MYNKLRKMFGPPEPSPIESSDDEYQPHSSNVSKKGNSFAGLEISSSKSESEDSEHSEDSEISEACDIEEKNKSNKKIKINLKKSEMVEDIDQIVQEVNATLGKMSPQKDPSTLKKINTFETVFSVKKVYLKFTNERHNFLPPHKGKKNRKKQIDGIVENPITELKGPFKHKGISMSIVRIENGINYFVYNHNPSYQQQHKRMIEYLLDRDRQDEDSIIYCLQNMHVEGIIESCSIYCNANNYQDAMKFLEEVIAYLHFVADPLFNISNGKTRLEYKYLENRTYHIAVLQYSFFVGAMGYERTALELVKMLLTLDPTDPLAIVCIIDSFALKAGEFEWLIDAVDVLDKERDAKLLCNIKYSYALAHFNVLSKNKEDLKLADDLLKDAIMSFPSGPMAILSNVGLSKEDQRTERIRKHSLFNDYAFKSTSKQLYQLIGFYGALNGQCWQKWSVLEWLIRNAHELMDSYDNDPQTKDEFKRHERIRRTLFKACPFEVLRQLWVIKDMAGHLKVKDAMPTLPLDPLFSFNPVPPMGDNTVNRYGYKEMICLNYY